MVQMDRIRREINKATSFTMPSTGSTLRDSIKPEGVPSHPPSSASKADFKGIGHEAKVNEVVESKGSAPPMKGSGDVQFRKELEEQIKKIDATKGVTYTEKLPSGADVVVEALRQKQFLDMFKNDNHGP